MTITADTITIAQIEEEFGHAAASWHGRCFSVATVAANLIARPSATAVYGHYLGNVDPEGYWGARLRTPFTQHGWVALDDGRILDPTRFSFENVEPYVAVFAPDDCAFDDYDEGGNVWRKTILRPCPDTTSKPPMALDVRPETRQFIEHLLPEGMAFEQITLDQVSWLANVSYEDLGNLVPDLYLAIVRAESFAIAFIPLDNRRMAEREFGIDLKAASR
jgi:hypothetical protein